MAAPTKRASAHATAQGNGIAAGSPTNISPGVNPSVGSFMVLRVGGFMREATAATVTDNNGNTWTQQVLQRNNKAGGTTQGVCAGIWTSTLTSVATLPLVVSYNPTSPAGTHFDGLIIDELLGVDTVTPIEASAVGANGDTGSTMTANLADTTNDCVKLGVGSWWGAATGTPTAGNTLSGWTGDGVDEGNAVQAALGVFKSVTGADTIDPTATLSAADNFAWAAIAFRGAIAGGTPTITATSTARPAIGSSLTITGTNFQASQGAGSVTINGQAQSVTAWADTSITITVSRGASKYGAASLIVTNNSALASSPFALTELTPQSGWSYVNIASPNTSSSVRLTATPDIAAGDQIAWQNNSGNVTVFSDGVFWAASSILRFDFEVWTTDGWGTTATQYIGELALYAWPPVQLQRRGRANRALLDPKTWFGPISVEKWFADELTAPAGGANVTVALTGVQATGAAGTATTITTLAATGSAAAGALGTLAPALSAAAMGTAAAGSVNAPAPGASIAATGVPATGGAGTGVASLSAALTGSAATGAVGTVGAAGSGAAALTGVAASAAVGTLAPAVSVQTSGTPATGAAGNVSASTGATAALTGVQASAAAGTASSSVAVALTGAAASGATGNVGAAGSGTAAITGAQAAGAAGAPGVAVVVALTGVAASAAIGSVKSATAEQLLGASAAAGFGITAPGTAVAIAGVQGAGAAGVVSPPANVTAGLSGVAATGRVGSVFAPGAFVPGNNEVWFVPPRERNFAVTPRERNWRVEDH